MRPRFQRYPQWLTIRNPLLIAESRRAKRKVDQPGNTCRFVGPRIPSIIIRSGFCTVSAADVVSGCTMIVAKVFTIRWKDASGALALNVITTTKGNEW